MADGIAGPGGRRVGKDRGSVAEEGLCGVRCPGGEQAPLLVAVQEGTLVPVVRWAWARRRTVGQQQRGCVMNPQAASWKRPKVHMADLPCALLSGWCMALAV